MIQDPDTLGRAAREVRQILAAVGLCFFFSGTTGLIYEVLWTRMLGLVFGHTVFAITTVLAAFMAGLGLGSYFLGRLADRQGQPLRLYGVLEAGIGLYALLTPFLFSRAEGIYIALRRSLDLSLFAFSLSQFILIFVILLVPTTLMGATLPVLGRVFVEEIQSLGSRIGRLYALNTFGAVLGAYAAGFHLIPILGIRTTLLLAAIMNIGIGVLAVVFDRHLGQLGVPPASSRLPSRVSGQLDLLPRPKAGDGGRGVAVWLCVVGLGVSGAASMIYEVAWTRVLALVIGSSTYAFSTMLVTFLGGLALGSYVFSRLAGRLTVNPFLFGHLQLGIGLTALLVTPFLDRMPELFLWAFRLSQSPAFMKILQFSLSALAMLLPTLFMGATFPCVAQIASRELSRLGQDVGWVYFTNTVGAIAGTVAAGFLWIPVWGLQATLKLAVSLNLLLALTLFAASSQGRWTRRLALPVPLLGLALLSLLPSWNAKALASGVAIYSRNYFGLLGKADFREAMASADRLLTYEDGISATVTVHQRGDHIFLKINGKTDASNKRDMHTQLMLGHLPLLLHPDPKRVLVIGLGSGVTAGAVAGHPVEAVDVIEIEPAVARASAFFAKENRDVLEDPRVRLAIADGRNFLLGSERAYDVITSEPSNPWMRGIGNLFSLEFYRLAATRLAPQGIMCQWIHGYGLFPEDLKMVVKTFRQVFPHTTIWETGLGDLLLVGSREPLWLEYSRLQSRFNSRARVREDMARVGFRSPMDLLADFFLGEEDAARYAEQAWLNTDDLPLLEFSAPDSLYADTVDLNRRMMKSVRVQEFPPLVGLPEGTLQSSQLRLALGQAFLAKGMPDEALAQFTQVLRLDARNPVALLQRGKGYLRAGSVLKAEADYKAVLRIAPRSLEGHEALGQLYKAQQLWELAEAHFRQAVTLNQERAVPGPTGRSVPGRAAHREAIPHFLAALALTPNDPSLWAGPGAAYRGVGQLEETLGAFRRALTVDPENPYLHYQVGLSYVALKRWDEAAAALRTAASKDPLKPEPYLELGALYRARQERQKALDAFRQALRLDPVNIRALRAVEQLSALAHGPGA